MNIYHRDDIPDDLLEYFEDATEIGQEDTPDAYVARIVEVFQEVRRVLHWSGVAFVVIGDTYASKHDKDLGIKPKDRIGIPHMLAFALRASGWWFRDECVWHKPNPLPSSSGDKTTYAHEFVFMFSKRAKYFHDGLAIAELAIYAGDNRGARKDSRRGTECNSMSGETAMHRNKRSVWKISTQPTKHGHSASYPERLVETCILSGSSARGCCPECLSPWRRITEKIRVHRDRPNARTSRHEQGGGVNACDNTAAGVFVKTIGWKPTCQCGVDVSMPCTVLDPFAGSGTTCVVAQKLHRHSIGIDLNPEYFELSASRFSQRLLPEFSDIT